MLGLFVDLRAKSPSRRLGPLRGVLHCAGRTNRRRDGPPTAESSRRRRPMQSVDSRASPRQENRACGTRIRRWQASLRVSARWCVHSTHCPTVFLHLAQEIDATVGSPGCSRICGELGLTKTWSWQTFRALSGPLSPPPKVQASLPSRAGVGRERTRPSVYSVVNDSARTSSQGPGRRANLWTGGGAQVPEGVVVSASSAASLIASAVSSSTGTVLTSWASGIFRRTSGCVGRRREREDPRTFRG